MFMKTGQETGAINKKRMKLAKEQKKPPWAKGNKMSKKTTGRWL
jgi:hypothetical protein